MPTVGSLAWALIADNTRFAAGTAAARKLLKQLKGELFGIKGAANVATTAFGSFGVALSGAAITAGFASMIRSSLETIDNLNDLSERLGVSTERLAGLGYAAQQNGSSAEALNDSLDAISKTIGILNERGGRNVEVLAGMGVNVAALARQSPDEMFLSLADAMNKLGTAQERGALASLLKLGPEMVNVLSQGRDLLEENVAEAERLGIAISKIDAQQIAHANDAWDRMTTAIKGVSNTITITLAPIIEEAAQGIERLATGMEDLDRSGRSESQQALIDEASGASWIQGLFLANSIDRQNKDFAWLQNLANVPDVTPEQLQELAIQEGGGAFTNTRDLAAERAAMEQLDREGKAERARQSAQDQLEREAERMRQSLMTPSESLAAEVSNLERLFASTGMSDETFRRGLLDIQERARGKLPQAEGLAGTQSTAAIRAGSIEALRAQFSGSLPQKQLKEAEKQTKEQEAMRGLLETIADTIQGVAEAPG